MQDSTTTYDPVTKIWSGQPHTVNFDLSKSVGKILLDGLAVRPDRIAQINHDTGYEMTAREMRQKAVKFARQLSKLHVNRGDFIAIISRNHDNLVPLIVGTIASGVIMNPLDVHYSFLEITHFLKLVNPKLIVCEESVLTTVQRVINENNFSTKVLVIDDDFPASTQYMLLSDLLRGYENESPDFHVPPIRDEDEVIFIYNSSGTTGLPKGVCLNHVATAAGLQTTNNRGMGELRSFTTSGLVWFTGISFILNPVAHQGLRIITKQKPSAKLILEILSQHKIHFFFCEPTLYGDVARLVDENPDAYDLSNLVVMATGGSRVPGSVFQLLNKNLPKLYTGTGYGATEVNGNITYASYTDEDALGHLTTGIQVKILDDDNKQVGPKKEGEIYVKTSFKALKYLRNDEANREGFTEDGWYRTGDIGYFNEDNILYLTGRKKFIFKYRNHHISPAEIESFLIDKFSTDIKAICVVPIPHDVGGNFASAVIVRAEDSHLTEEEVKKYVEDNLSDAKHLRGGVYFVDSLPFTATGKIRISAVKEMALGFFNESKSQ